MDKINKIHIIGLGPAGTAFGISFLENSTDNTRIIGFDYSIDYEKPCGEAIPLLNINQYFIEPTIIKEVYSVTIKNNNQTIFQKTYSTPIWYMIDKTEWIRKHRKLFEKKGGKIINKRIGYNQQKTNNNTLIVDARGPYSDNTLKKIPIVRAIVETREPIDDVELNFDTENIGLQWIFPSKKNHLNIGYGSLFIKDPKTILLSRIKKSKHELKIKRIDISIITINGPLNNFYNNKKLYVGEAAGFVYALTGEGIRPSYIQAKKLGENLALTKNPFTANTMTMENEGIKKIMKEIRFQTRLLKTMTSIKFKDRKKIFNCLIKESFERLLQENLGLTDIIIAWLRCPWLLKYLL